MHVDGSSWSLLLLFPALSSLLSEFFPASAKPLGSGLNRGVVTSHANFLQSKSNHDSDEEERLLFLCFIRLTCVDESFGVAATSYWKFQGFSLKDPGPSPTSITNATNAVIVRTTVQTLKNRTRRWNRLEGVISQRCQATVTDNWANDKEVSQRMRTTSHLWDFSNGLGHFCTLFVG